MCCEQNYQQTWWCKAHEAHPSHWFGKVTFFLCFGSKKILMLTFEKPWGYMGWGQEDFYSKERASPEFTSFIVCEVDRQLVYLKLGFGGRANYNHRVKIFLGLFWVKSAKVALVVHFTIRRRRKTTLFYGQAESRGRVIDFRLIFLFFRSLAIRSKFNVNTNLSITIHTFNKKDQIDISLLKIFSSILRSQ